MRSPRRSNAAWRRDRACGLARSSPIRRWGALDWPPVAISIERAPDSAATSSARSKESSVSESVYRPTSMARDRNRASAADAGVDEARPVDPRRADLEAVRPGRERCAGGGREQGGAAGPRGRDPVASADAQADERQRRRPEPAEPRQGPSDPGG